MDGWLAGWLDKDGNKVNSASNKVEIESKLGKKNITVQSFEVRSLCFVISVIFMLNFRIEFSLLEILTSLTL